jgi:hypothetical protein
MQKSENDCDAKAQKTRKNACEKCKKGGNFPPHFLFLLLLFLLHKVSLAFSN